MSGITRPGSSDVGGILNQLIDAVEDGTGNTALAAEQAAREAADAALAPALVPTAVKTGDYVSSASDLVPIDTTTGNVTVTLPSAPVDGARIAVKLVKQAGGHTVTIQRGGTDVFNAAAGSTSVVLTLLNQAVSLQYKSSGGVWYVVGDDLPLSQLDSRYVSVNGGSMPTLSRVAVFGHSYVEGSGASRNGVANWGYGMAEVVGRLLGARVDNRAIAGSNIAGTVAPALSSLILNHLPIQVGPPFASPFESVAIFSAINDMTGSDRIAEPTIMSDYIYGFCLRLRAIAGDPARGGAGTWALAQGSGGLAWTQVGNSFCMGTGVQGAQANGNTWTITLPSTFPGGTIYILGIRQFGTGATHSITVDGSAFGTWDTRGATQSTFRPSIYKMAGLAAGAHTIIGTIGSLAGSVEYLQGWLLDSPDAPPIAYAGANRAPAYPTGAHTIVDADIAAVNAVLSTVAANFADGRVTYVDVDTPLGKNSAYFDSVGFNGGANIHPNNEGHAIIGAALASALIVSTPAEGYKARPLALPGDFLSTPRLIASTDPFDKPRIGTATLDGTGNVVVTTRALQSEGTVFLTAVDGTGIPRVSAQTASAATVAGTFTITSSVGASDSGKKVNWMIFDTTAR